MRIIGLAALALAAALAGAPHVSAAELGRSIPPPVTDEKGIVGKTAVATFAGGCFWGVQGVFQHVNGVLSAVSGYAGGEISTADYHKVGTGSTGHAEAVQITYDPSKVTYGKLLQIYFAVAHNPTQFNYQGPDHGPQYRSAIFPENTEQADLAKAYIKQLNEAKAFDAAIVTRIEPDKAFYKAEDYHQDYLTLNPHQPYIVAHDMPKLGELKKYFADLYREKPTLVGVAKAE